MENASKALLIAGTTIIGVMIITIFVYVFREGSKINEAYDQKQQNNQLELYNSKFEQYNRDNNTIMDMISVCNLAFSINEATKTSIGKDDSEIKYYDNTNAVQIEIELIDGAKFIIPNTINEENPSLSKNQIIYKQRSSSRGNVISIYRLASETLESIQGKEPNGTGKLSNTHLDSTNNKRIYKYLFKCTNDDNRNCL